jgi:hypothetical protein
VTGKIKMKNALFKRLSNEVGSDEIYPIIIYSDLCLIKEPVLIKELFHRNLGTCLKVRVGIGWLRENLIGEELAQLISMRLQAKLKSLCTHGKYCCVIYPDGYEHTAPFLPFLGGYVERSSDVRMRQRQCLLTLPRLVGVTNVLGNIEA